MDINRLLRDELSYELLIRGCGMGTTVDEKRSILREAITNGKPILSDIVLNWESEIHICSSKLDQLLGEIQEFPTDNKDNEYRKIHTRLIHAKQRVSRIPSSFSEAQQLSELCDTLLKDLQTAYNTPAAHSSPSSVAHEQSILSLPNVMLPEVLHNTASVHLTEQDVGQLIDAPVHGGHSTMQSRHATAGTSDLARALDNLAFSGHHPVRSVSPLPSWYLPHHVNYTPISKWNLKFDGESSSVSAFLQKVEELRCSRGVSKQQLLQAAIEIFTGNALFWYRSVRHTIKDWDNLVEQIKATFLPHDYEMSLWVEIRSRTQHKLEKVAIYVAIMENLFSRLPKRPAEEKRIAIIRRNLQPYLVTGLALQHISTVNELIAAARQVENAQSSAALYQPPPMSSHSLLEPDLAFQKPKPSKYQVSETYQSPQDISAVSTSSSYVIKCWNCSEVGHHAGNCKKPKRLHCYRCGHPDTTSKNCPKCSKNGQ